MIPIIFEIAAWAGEAPAFAAWTRDGLLRSARAGGARALDSYERAPDPKSEPGPHAIAYVGFAGEAEARRWLRAPATRSLLEPAETRFALRGELMAVHAFPIGREPPQPLVSRFSYVVRYELPADDVRHFQDYYMRMHPPILAEFEGIRNIFCYLPVGGRDGPLPGAGHLIGNEVVFDDAAAFGRAMASPVRAKSRADFETFPPFSGRNPHYPMIRTRLLGPGSTDE